MKKILFIEDDADYQKLINELLVLEGYEVYLANSPVEALGMFKEIEVDLVISDLMLDKIDGIQLVSLLKRINATIPIIILTGYVSNEKELQGLSQDIEDYIYKTVSIEVLLKRVARAINQRVGSINELISVKDSIVVNTLTRKVYKDSSLVKLTETEYNLLCFFLENKNVVFTREKLMDQVWNSNERLTDIRTVDTHIKKIRSKLDIAAINSVRGFGYEWFE